MTISHMEETGVVLASAGRHTAEHTLGVHGAPLKANPPSKPVSMPREKPLKENSGKACQETRALC